MSFFKRVLSSVGIGSAKVDTVLNREQFVPGEAMGAVVHITAGKVEQTIDEIYFSINTQYEAEVERDGESDQETHTTELANYKLGEKLHLAPGQKEEISIEIDLPIDTPLTVGQTRVWVQTGLDIKNAVDPGDRDYIEVVPDHLLGGLLDSLDELGFRLYEAECEAVSPTFKNRLPFVQELEFKPVAGPFRGALDEVEIVYFHRGDHVDVYMEIDRRARGVGGFMSEMLDRDETRIRFTITEDDLGQLTQMLHDTIEEYS